MAEIVLEALERRILLSGAFVADPAGAAPALDVQAAHTPGSFQIVGDRFHRDGEEVFLNLIGYQPLEPGQEITGEIRPARIEEDLLRWQAYRGGSDPLLFRVYAQPTETYPVRMPQAFYDGVRELDFWIVRDIYFGSGLPAFDITDLDAGRARVDAVIAEVDAVGGFDRIFAWEIGDEFQVGVHGTVGQIEAFISAMSAHVKGRLAEPGREGFSNWVTWASWPPSDALRTEGARVLPDGLDYVSYNAYSYEPDRLRDHQGGCGTGRPYAGYLSALCEYHPSVPVVVSETGLPDSSAIHPNHVLFKPWAPAYRKGGLTDEQVAEGLADRYWDARLSGVISGFGLFEWNDEWHKTGQAGVHNSHPEEHFGILRFDCDPVSGDSQARCKLQHETVRELLTRKHTPGLIAIAPDQDTLGPTDTTTIRATVSPELVGELRFRWETSRGMIVGDTDAVQLYGGNVALGEAVVTATVTDLYGRSSTAETTVTIQPQGPPTIEVLTLGTGRASGRVDNVDLSAYKLACWIETDMRYVQPYDDVPSIWVRPDGYWWTVVNNGYDGDLYVYLVPRGDPVGHLPWGTPPAGFIAEAVGDTANDADNDLLADDWEAAYWPVGLSGRWDDVDGDVADNLEEYLAGGDPTEADNDIDADGLKDNWERLFFGHLGFGGGDDADGDGLDNLAELSRGTHPGRAAVDRDDGGLPDLWEMRISGSLDLDPAAQPILRDYYEIGLLPADANLDGEVGYDDYAAVRDGYGTLAGAVWTGGDLDFDGDVDWRDYALVKGHFGESFVPPTVPPAGPEEPEAASDRPGLWPDGLGGAVGTVLPWRVFCGLAAGCPAGSGDGRGRRGVGGQGLTEAGDLALQVDQRLADAVAIVFAGGGLEVHRRGEGPAGLEVGDGALDGMGLSADGLGVAPLDGVADLGEHAGGVLEKQVDQFLEEVGVALEPLEGGGDLEDALAGRRLGLLRGARSRGGR